MQKSFHVTASSIYPLGVCFVPEGLHIAAICDKETDCGILLFDKNHKDGIKIPFLQESRKGNIHAMLLQGYHDKDCTYLFYQGEELFQDNYAYALENERKYGEDKEIPSRCKVLGDTYDWEEDKSPTIPFEESIIYMLHVRGFTKHRSSGVRAKGTYAGVMEKIPYLKELGINAVLLMPTYEFDEILRKEKQPQSMEQAALFYKEKGEQEEPIRINYWGYQEGLYFLPKYAYSHKKDAVTEFKDLVKALHQNGIEILMQFYFPPTVGYTKMFHILKYWVLEYHIDGFQLMGNDIPLHTLRKEPLLAETKLIGEKDDHSGETGNPADISANVSFYRNFGYMNDNFLYDMRRLLKGDANMIESLVCLCRKNPTDRGIVNYIAKQDGFRLYDLVSYNNKHNEPNGEDNQDGNSENFSWNCGIEGKTRKKDITNLRLRQMKNALSFVMLSQGTPLLYSGDEFANSQEGNNNPYCQDNPVCWIKWKHLKIGEELLAYTKELIALRKRHSILHMRTPLRGMDHLSCGYPDISFHGREAWIPNTSSESRSLGIMYCCRYGKDEDKAEETLLYLGINMHWMTQQFGLPQIPKGLEWVRILSTDSRETEREVLPKADQETLQYIQIPPRTVMIYSAQRGRTEEEYEEKEKTIKKKRNIKRTRESS